MSETVYTVDVLGDTGLVEALITRSLTEFIDESCSKLGPRALAGATNLTKVQCDNVTAVETEAFSGCKALKTLSLPKVTSVTKCEYANLTSLTELNLPAVTSISKQYAFQDCTALTKVDFPVLGAMGVGKSYGSWIFSGCSSLETVILRKTSGICKLDNASVFGSTPITKGTGYVYVPSALIADYEADPVWTEVGAQFRAIEDYPEICGV